MRTAPDHFLPGYPASKFRRFAHALPADMTGKSVLDIGCNAGFYSLEMKRRGADRVLGVDFDDRYLDQARLAAEVEGADAGGRRLEHAEAVPFRRHGADITGERGGGDNPSRRAVSDACATRTGPPVNTPSAAPRPTLRAPAPRSGT